MTTAKNPAAVAMGRLGGQARASALTKAQRSAIARKGGKARALKAAKTARTVKK